MLVNGDRALLLRAICNLLHNAVKYSPPATTIVLDLRARDAMVQCVVIDQGYGIDPGDIPDLFVRCHRGRAQDRGDAEGSGLGLALVKAVADKHGGHIAVTSERGRGSRFELSIPQTRQTGFD